MPYPIVILPARRSIGIFPGQLETAVARWFGRFPVGVESREDSYLLDPLLPGLSVKIRGGRALEV
jgi:hypothetical protein